MLLANYEDKTIWIEVNCSKASVSRGTNICLATQKHVNWVSQSTNVILLQSAKL